MTLRAPIFVLFWFIFSLVPAGAQTPNPITDIATLPFDGSSNPNRFATADDFVYFMADDGSRGSELWRTDGTAEGTNLVADFCPGSCSINAYAIETIGNRAFLGVGNWLWTSDGTDLGTRRLVAPCPSCETPYFSHGQTFGGSVFFLSNDEVLTGSQLWRSDGTPEGTSPVIAPAAFPGQIDFYGQPFSNGSMLIFATYDRGGETLLWRLDEPSAEPVLFTTYCDGCNSGPIGHWDLRDGRILFAASLPEFGFEPWVTDGTAEGTRMVADLAPGPLSGYTHGWQQVDGVVYGELANCEDDCFFRTDGTPEGTRLVPELLPVTLFPRDLLQLRSVGGHLYARMVHRFAGLEELWVLRDHDPKLIDHGNGIRFVGQVGAALAFSTSSGSGSRLKAVDGDPSSLRTLSEASTGFGAQLGDALIFNRFARVPYGDGQTRTESELWITRGQTLDAQPLPEPFGQRPGGANPRDLLIWPESPGGPSVVFRADQDLTSGSSLWRAGGARPAGQLWAEQLLTEAPTQMQGIADGTLFSFNDNPSNGTEAAIALRADGTREELDLAGELPVFIAAAGDRMFVSTSQPGQRLWVTSGSNDDTELLVDVQPGWDPYCQSTPCPQSQQFPRSMTALGDRLLFNAFATPSGADGPAELWISDGTQLGTQSIFEFEMDPDLGILARDHGPAHLTTAGARTYFTVFQKGSGTELWSTDGTPDGTAMVADYSPGAASSTFEQLSPWGESVAIVEPTPDGHRLLRAGPDGITLISGFEPDSKILEMRASEGLLFLAVDTPSLGQELWISNGAAGGTVPFDLRPGARGSGVSNLSPVPGGIFFAADDGPNAQGQEFGLEPWLSDGRRSTTRRMVDLFPGPTPSNPGPAALHPQPVGGSRLYFAADHPELGRELFAVDLTAAEVTCGLDELCFHDARFKVTMAWQTAEQSGTAQRVAAGPSSGLLWFFEPDNWEAMVKVLDGCAINDRYWIFAAIGTDVGYTLTATDTLSGEIRSYSNPIGTRSTAITDDQAFPCP